MRTDMHARPVVVGIGEILWDMLPAGKQLGGAVTNFAYHAQAQGAEGIIASCIGDDALGREIVERLASLRMSTAFLAVDDARPTGTVGVSLDDRGVPTFTIHTGVAWDFIPAADALLQLARRADVVCFGSLAQRSPVSRATIQSFLAATRPDCLRVFDINLRQSYFSREVIDASLSSAGVLKLNDAELPVVSELLGLPGDEPAAIRELIARYSLQLVALTRGDAGSRLYTRHERHDHPGYRVKVADSVGAGDSFTAALAMGLLRGNGLPLIHDHANRLASYVCTQPGATPPVPPELVFAASQH